MVGSGVPSNVHQNVPTSGGGYGLDSNSTITSGPSEEWNGNRKIISGPAG